MDRSPTIVLERSGAGKTTRLRCLAGATTATSVVIPVGDAELGALRARALRAPRRRVGMIHQRFNLIPRLRVVDNVLVGTLGRLTGWRSWAALAARK